MSILNGGMDINQARAQIGQLRIAIGGGILSQLAALDVAQGMAAAREERAKYPGTNEEAEAEGLLNDGQLRFEYHPQETAKVALHYADEFLIALGVARRQQTEGGS